MNKLVPYFQVPGAGEDVLDDWPGLDSALFMDIGPAFAAHLRQKYPGLKICLRLYEGDLSWQTTSPEDWAARFVPVRPEYAVSWTMPLGQDDRTLFAAFDDWSVRFATAVRKEGIEPIGLCVGTGNFTGAGDRIKVSDAFPGICQSYNILGPQDYGWPTLQSQIGRHALRWMKWHDDIKERFGKEMSFMPMECGLTQAVLGRLDLGWQSGADGVTDDSYVATMRWYNERLCELPYVVRAYIYLFHGYNDWETFDHVNRPEVWHKIRDFDAAGEEPEPPDGGNEMKVFNRDGQELTGQAATDMVAYYGLSFEAPPGLADGDLYFALVALREKTGDSAFIHRILDAKGDPIQATDIRAFWWPNMSGDDNDVTEKWPTDIWHPDADLGETNERGEGGSGMGDGAYHGTKVPGPHHAWVRHPQYKSTILRGVGMIAGTFHDHMDGEWKLMAYAGTTPVPPSGDPIARLHQMATELNAIADGLATSGVVTTVTVTYSGGQQVIFKPSLAASVVRAVRSVFGR